MSKITARTVTLPSGATAEVVEGKGKHLRMASRLVSPDDPMGLGMALASILATVDGKALTLEDVEAMPLKDALALTTAIMGNDNSSLTITSSH